MNTETTLWARKPDAEEWQEEIITSSSDPAHVAKARVWAESQGFTHFRLSTFTPSERPDFARTLNSRRK